MPVLIEIMRRVNLCCCCALVLVWLGLSSFGPRSVLAGDSIAPEAAAPFTAEQLSYWAFQPPRQPTLPRTAAANDGVRTPIDAFIYDRLAERRLAFSTPAHRLELLRRAKFDLHGLPPTPDEIEQFLADSSPRAFERLVDRLLASPRYGEAWGRHWLDLVRFAETAGFNADPLRPLAYKYRDYVIRAFNSDTPYDRFVLEQLAGDELFSDDPEALIATGFNLLWPDESNASNVLLARQDALNDLTASIGSVFLGMSIGCAQCHDHKFDPLLQTDFYQLQAFFAGIVPRESVALGSPAELIAYQQQRQRWLAESRSVRQELHALESAARAASARIKRLKFPAIVLEAIDTIPEARSSFQQQLCFWSERQIIVSEKQLLAELTAAQQARRQQLKQRLEKLQAAKPQPPRQLKALVSLEAESGPPPTHLLSGGSYDDPLEELQPGFFSILTSTSSGAPLPEAPRDGTSGRRSTLARWIASPQNPLTARVIVNRVWQSHFGRGLVRNGNDFGVRTAPPSHPRLLDWLTTEFVESGWSIKSLHRLIMSSAVYRQSTYRRPASGEVPHAAQVDPGNQLWWHFPRRRLSAEGVRDSMLAIAGRINWKMFGPGIKPELPPDFSARHAWEPTKNGAERERRSVYIHAKRNLPYPLLQVFDLPDMHESCAQRAQTTVAPQALMVLNSELILGFARSFAKRLRAELPHAGLGSLVHRAYLLAYGRPPDDQEVSSGVQFISQQCEILQRESLAAGENAAASSTDNFDDEAVADFCHALINSNEFLYLD